MYIYICTLSVELDVSEEDGQGPQCNGNNIKRDNEKRRNRIEYIQENEQMARHLKIIVEDEGVWM